MYNKESENYHKKIINFVLSSPQKCIRCKNMQQKIRCDVCQCVLYCSQVCRKSDQIKHLKDCKKQSVVMQSQKNSNNKSGYKMGLVGLENIGNTCYLNSSLQCLSHTTALTQYFYDQHYKNEINSTNLMGSQGRVVQRYAEFIRSMWFGKQQVYKPIQLKKQIGIKNPQFAYKSQEDANQFLITLIDLIHEDLNRITQRPNIQRPDILGKCPQDAAKITWLYNYRFNQSIITDLMTGLYRSIVYCRECKKQSSTFEPYRTINLPIPNQNEQKQLKFYVLYDNFRKPVISSSIVYKLIQQKKLAEEAAKQIGEENKTFKLYFLSKANDIQNCEQIQQLSIFQTIMEDEQAFLIQLSPLQEAIVNKCTLTFFFSNQKNNSIWLKRPIFIDIEFETGQSILKRILKYLYNSVYKYPQKLTILGMEGTSYEKYEIQMLRHQVFVLKLMKIKGRYGRIVYYQDQIGQTLQRDGLLLDSIKQLLYGTQSKQNYQQNIPVSQIEKQFELKIEISDLGYKFFDFQKLYIGIQEMKKQGYKKKIEKNEIGKIGQKYESKVSLQKCLDAFGSDEKLHGDITWYCSQCQKQTKANKRISIYQTPDVLIFVLNRFKVKQDGRKQKIKRPVDIPFEINMEKYVTDHRPMSCYIEHAKKKLIYKSPPYAYEPSTKPIQRFELYAFIRHDGQINHGHYTAYAKNSVQWYFFNDKSVQQVNYNQIQKNNAYILFYRRKKK